MVIKQQLRITKFASRQERSKHGTLQLPTKSGRIGKLVQRLSILSKCFSRLGQVYGGCVIDTFDVLGSRW